LTGLDALAWAKKASAWAPERFAQFIDADGTQKGYELRLTELIA